MFTKSVSTASLGSGMGEGLLVSCALFISSCSKVELVVRAASPAFALSHNQS